ncbi:hypothetical protein ACFSUM_18695 [Virgibacillus siamensis]|uniref:hypothetical protein n=2 Tax=Bacillati TaxID=1783272 RepID=UPI003624F0BE
MDREEAKKIFKKLAASYPSWKVDKEIAENWIEELEEADPEHAWANVKQHIRESKYAPSLSEIIQKNPEVNAEREKERTRKMLDAPVKRNGIPPWVKEGMERQEWWEKFIAERKKGS